MTYALNSAHHAIKVTIEEEAEESLPFLDIKVIRRLDGTIPTRMYYKPTWTGQFTNFHSYVPVTMKRNLVRNLMSRIDRLVAPEFRYEDKCKIKQVLLGNVESI